MKIIVIGSEGFIGKHLMDQGRKLGHEMVGVDIVGTPDIRASSGGISYDGFDRVIHSAGMLGTQETIASPHDAVSANIVNTLLTLENCRNHGISFTYITLGNNWLNPYSITKNCAADFVRMFNRVNGLPTQVAVAYNLFGPYQKWKPVRKIVPEFMTRILDGKPVQLWFGGTMDVDMVYAPDVARAIIENQNVGTEHYGSAVKRRVLDVAEDCARALGRGVGVEMLGPRPGETGNAAIAPYPIRNQTPYTEAMKTTADWYREHYH